MKFSANQKSITGLIIISAIIVTSGYIINASLTTLYEHQKSIQHTYIVLDKINLILSNIQDIETGARGYIITKNPLFLEQNNIAIYNTQILVKELRDLTLNDTIREYHKKLENLIEQKIEQTNESIELANIGKSDQDIELVSNQSGKILMDDIIQTIKEMYDIEYTLLNERSNNAQSTFSNLSFISIITSVIIIITVIIVYAILDKDSKIKTRNIQKLQAEFTDAKEKLQLELTDATAKEQLARTDATAKEQLARTDATAKEQLARTDAKELEEKLKAVAKDEFSAMITHELNTPLVPIIGYCEMFKISMLGKLNEEQTDAIEVIEKSAKRLETLITDIMDVRKLDLDQMKFSIDDLSLDEFFSNLDSDYRRVLENKGCQFTANPHAKNLVIKTDKARLRQVFDNLIGNSIKFMPDNKGSIEIGCMKENQDIVFHVKDNGAGIPLDKQNRIFQKFYQIDTTERRSIGGTGLGLAISKGIVEKLGGKIWFESDGKTGTTFYMKFPMIVNMA